ncbi:NADP-dependent malic enzyme [Clostridium sardiniense]|uniref:NADP-dependent malic enzyme n=1 Tax=Clostridium sardiniense TaxID=29369 RepID=A0ABS7KSY0_CLOSR|nr:NADP-dependent malic enzyme [Clostridium sardiniense]MBY0753909.1 NADP-dependent malic enzyme [Clostridium sardiniense]MDQ0459576.1 malate dehydrogenase (oxaloacetate-decarboxylating) [Clostridium sardiniense]
MNIYEEALEFHKELRGKLEIKSRVKVNDEKDLSLAYTPGVAEPCRKIHENKELVNTYTRKWNTVAVVSDGTAVLGLGDIGPEAALPVMEGKSVLFKEFGDVDAIPIVLDTKDVDEIVDTVVRMAPTFGGINLEDISGPRCFEIEKKLQERLDIPVFHDDQHGTAIVVLSALINALKVVDKNKEDIKIVINGAGAAGCAIAKLLLSWGAKNIVMCNINGVLHRDMEQESDIHRELVKVTNLNNEKGGLSDVIKNADVFIGVSAGNVLSKEMVETMNKDAIVFAMANPVPEIFPEDAKEAGARVVGTGRSDFKNQINNVLAFPGMFRGALDGGAKRITEEMKLAAAFAIADSVKSNELSEDYIMPKPFDRDVQIKVAEEVRKAVKYINK